MVHPTVAFASASSGHSSIITIQLPAPSPSRLTTSTCPPQPLRIPSRPPNLRASRSRTSASQARLPQARVRAGAEKALIRIAVGGQRRQRPHHTQPRRDGPFIPDACCRPGHGWRRRRWTCPGKISSTAHKATDNEGGAREDCTWTVVPARKTLPGHETACRAPSCHLLSSMGCAEPWLAV